MGGSKNTSLTTFVEAAAQLEEENANLGMQLEELKKTFEQCINMKREYIEKNMRCEIKKNMSSTVTQV